jgi:hypothetical protein
VRYSFRNIRNLAEKIYSKRYPKERAINMVLTILKNANLALAFFLELGVLASLGYWGFQTGQGMPIKIALGIGAPILAIVIWALFGAPKATWHLEGFWRLLLQIIFFGGAALALYVAGQRGLGVAFALIFILNTLLAYLWNQ